MSFLTSIFQAVGSAVPRSVVDRAAREYLNQRFASFGTITTLQIDSTRKSAILDLELKGETQPLHIVIDQYELTKSGGSSVIEIKQLAASREWINALANEFLKEKKIKIPDYVSGFL